LAAPLYVAVVGPGEATGEQVEIAEAVGRGLAQSDAIVVCGGLGGVMEAACRGARDAGGITVGLLPGADRTDANPHLTISIPTGMGELRNGLVVRSAEVVIVVGGGYGTLSEVALALKAGIRVIGLATWSFDAIESVDSASHAVQLAVRPHT